MKAIITDKSTYIKALVLALAVVAFFILFSSQKALADGPAEIDLTGSHVTFGEYSLRDLTTEELSFIESGDIIPIDYNNMDAFYEAMEPGTFDISDDTTSYTIQTRAYSDVGKQYIGAAPIPLPPVTINCQFQYTSGQRCV